MKLYQLLVFMMFFTSCGKTPVPGELRPEGVRTLIIYMGGDNNLSGETYSKINSIQRCVSSDRRFGKGSGYEILIFQDPDKGSGAVPRLLRAKYGELEVLRTYESSNSASAELFKQVIGECKTIAPARSYGLWVFSHASGWLPRGALQQSRSIIVDGTDEMEIKDFASALEPNAFEFILFEACFMAGVEVAYELRDKTNYIVGSSAEMLSPGFINIYEQVIPLLATTQRPKETLVKIATDYYNHWNSQSEVDSRSATISVIATSKLDRLADLCSQITCSHSALNEVSELQKFDRNRIDRLFFDLGQYMNTLSNNSRSEELDALLREIVIYKAATATFMPTQNGFSIDHHSGLTTYIAQSRFSGLNLEYDKLNWARRLANS